MMITFVHMTILRYISAFKGIHIVVQTYLQAAVAHSSSNKLSKLGRLLVVNDILT